MNIIKYFLLLTCCVLLSACGPLRGQSMMAEVGLKNYTVTRGDILQLKEAKNLLVAGPFWGTGTEQQSCIPKTDCIYPDNMDLKFVTKYNDARRFAHGLQEADLFSTELYLEVDYNRLPEMLKRLKTMTGLEIQKEFALKQVPEMILFGVVEKREHKVAPLHGIIVDVHYELEFYKPDSRQSILIDVAVVGVFKEDMKTIIRETKSRLGLQVTPVQEQRS